VLIIDEVSMLDAAFLDWLDRRVRVLRSKEFPSFRFKPFGGIQLVFAGDFHQLPAVSDDKAAPSMLEAAPRKTVVNKDTGLPVQPAEAPVGAGAASSSRRRGGFVLSGKQPKASHDTIIDHDPYLSDSQCFTCGGFGHWARQCPNRPAGNFWNNDAEDADVFDKDIPLRIKELGAPPIFQTACFKEAKFQCVELTEVFRQRDAEFVQALEKVRIRVFCERLLQKRRLLACMRTLTRVRVAASLHNPKP